MEFGASSPSSLCLCRICHEEEDENSTAMEAPCSCSGTQKFAHRECIQKWCDEKGSIICEICLEVCFLCPYFSSIDMGGTLVLSQSSHSMKFEPGYTFHPKLDLIDIAVTIRGSLEVPSLNYESENQGSDDESDHDYPECSPASDRATTVCRSIALMLSLFLLARHFVVVVSAGSSDYPFTIATVFMLRASGIIVPLYFFMQLIAVYQKARRQHLRHVGAIQAVTREACIAVVEGDGDSGTSKKQRFPDLRGENCKKSLEAMVRSTGKESFQWGLAAGMYSGLTYGLREARGSHDWTNSAVAGAVTGAALALTAEDTTREQIVQSAITGAAFATAANLLSGIF